jgi:hypothetical protein
MLTGILASLGVPWANATVEVRIINALGGGDTGWIQCAATSCMFSGAVGNYSVALDSAIQNFGINPFLDLDYQANTTVTGAGTIIFEAMANGYTLNTPETKLVGNGNSTLGDTVSVASFGGNNNTICAAGVNTCTPTSNGSTTLDSLTGLPEPLSVTAVGGGNTVNPYSLGIVLALNNPVNAGGASGDIALDGVPEPTSVVLLGGVLLFTASGLRRKMRRSA